MSPLQKRTIDKISSPGDEDAIVVRPRIDSREAPPPKPTTTLCRSSVDNNDSDTDRTCVNLGNQPDVGGAAIGGRTLRPRLTLTERLRGLDPQRRRMEVVKKEQDTATIAATSVPKQGETGATVEKRPDNEGAPELASHLDSQLAQLQVSVLVFEGKALMLIFLPQTDNATIMGHDTVAVSVPRLSASRTQADEQFFCETGDRFKAFAAAASRQLATNAVLGLEELMSSPMEAGEPADISRSTSSLPSLSPISSGYPTIPLGMVPSNTVLDGEIAAQTHGLTTPPGSQNHSQIDPALTDGSLNNAPATQGSDNTSQYVDSLLSSPDIFNTTLNGPINVTMASPCRPSTNTSKQISLNVKTPTTPATVIKNNSSPISSISSTKTNNSLAITSDGYTPLNDAFWSLTKGPNLTASALSSALMRAHAQWTTDQRSISQLQFSINELKFSNRKASLLHEQAFSKLRMQVSMGSASVTHNAAGEEIVDENARLKMRMLEMERDLAQERIKYREMRDSFIALNYVTFEAVGQTFGVEGGSGGVVEQEVGRRFKVGMGFVKECLTEEEREREVKAGLAGVGKER